MGKHVPQEILIMSIQVSETWMKTESKKQSKEGVSLFERIWKAFEKEKACFQLETHRLSFALGYQLFGRPETIASFRPSGGRRSFHCFDCLKKPI